MCYVLNTLQLMLVNPLIFVLLGIGKARREAPPGDESASTVEIVTSVLRGLARNFIIVSVVLGAARLRFVARVPTRPSVVLSRLLANIFSEYRMQSNRLSRSLLFTRVYRFISGPCAGPRVRRIGPTR